MNNIDILARKYIDDVRASPHAGQLMHTLCHDFGPRPATSEAMRGAARYLTGVLTDIGADQVHTERVNVLGWRNEPVNFELTSPQQHKFDAVEYVYSTAGDVNGALINGGSGTESELDRLGSTINNATLLIQGRAGGISGGRTFPVRQRVHFACQRGAAAVVAVNPDPCSGPMSESLDSQPQQPMIPVIGVDNKDGKTLETITQSGQPRCKIRTRGKAYSASCINLVAELGPAIDAQSVIALSAHLDTFHVNPGAFDNLSGVITLIEISRALAPLQLQFKRRLRLILFTAHEYGYAGSAAYVRDHRSTLDHIELLFNMDGLFDATAKGAAVMWAPSICKRIRAAYQESGQQVEVRNCFCMSSDYLPFMLAGVPTARPAAWDGSFPRGAHTRIDTPDRVPLEWIAANATVHGQMLLRLLTDPNPLPDDHNSREQLQMLRQEADADNVLQRYGL